MADRHRLGTFVNGRFTVALDLAPSSGVWAVERDTFNITPPVQTDIKVKNARRYGGSRRVGEIHDNGNLTAQWFIKGANLQASLAQLDTLLAILESSTTVYYWEWRPDGATYSTYFEVRGTSWEPLYRWVQTAGTGHLHVKLGVDVAPLALGDQLDIFDGFDVDTITAGDYTFDTGAGTLGVAGGLLTASSTAEKRLYHSARGYLFTDAQVTLKVTPGASVAATHSTGLILRRIDATNFLWASVDDTNTLRIFKRIAGADTQLATAAFTPAANTPFWVRFRTEGNVIAAEAFAVEPTLASTSATAALTYMLSTGEAATFGATVAGAAGARLIPKATDWTYDDFRVEPYTYRNRALPEVLDLRSIPGTAPAQFALSLGQPSSNPRVEPWGLVGWAPRPTVHNLVWNGDFEDAAIGTSGWNGVGAANVPAGSQYLAGTSTLSRITSAAKFGLAALQVVTPATSSAGASFPILRPFKKGVTYTADFWVRAPASTTVMAAYFGQINPGADYSAPTAFTLTAAWQQVTVTWTPTADEVGAELAIRLSAATASTFQVDGVRVYEGTVAPTTGKHSEGKGAYPPFGLLEAEAVIPSTLGSWAIVADGATHGGYYLGNAGTAGAFAAEWFVDPTLLAADDFGSEVSIDVYARFGSLSATAVSLTAILSAIAENNAGGRAYTAEWGSAGKTLTLPSSGAAARIVKLGTITLPVDTANPSRWRLKLALTGGVASFAYLDYLMLVPARQRALGPTAKANDTTYPALFHVSGVEELKTIRADLSGRYSQPPGVAGRDSGLGGQLLELAPGDTQALLKLSDIVPDDPTSSTYTEAGLTVTTSAHFAIQPRYQLTRTT